MKFKCPYCTHYITGVHMLHCISIYFVTETAVMNITVDDIVQRTIKFSLILLKGLKPGFCPVKICFDPNSDFIYLNTVNTMMHQQYIVAGVSWK